MGSPTRQLSNEERVAETKKLQALVDSAFEGFLGVIKEGRPKIATNTKRLKEISTGEIFNARRAQKLGLVDRLGFLEDAIDRAAAMAHYDAEEIQVVRYKKPATLFGGLLGQNRAEQTTKLGALVEMATPRAYYLSTWLPAALTNAAQ